MDFPEKRSEGLRAMSRFLVGEADLQGTLQRVLELSQGALPGADFAGMTLQTESGPRTSVFTDPQSPEIDQAQYDTGVGPCLQAMRDSRIYRVDSTEEDKRFPAFSAACLDHDILSTLSVPLSVGETDTAIGALNLYSRQRAGFDEDSERHASAFAEQAAIVLANATAYWDVHDLAENLKAALVNRAVIEQAKGIIIGQSRVTADEAFQLLVRASQRENRKLHEIASEIVDRAVSRAEQDA